MSSHLSFLPKSLFQNKTDFQQALYQIEATSYSDHLLSPIRRLFQNSSSLNKELSEFNFMILLSKGQDFIDSAEQLSVIYRIAQKFGLIPNNAQSVVQHAELNEILTMLFEKVMKGHNSYSQAEFIALLARYYRRRRDDIAEIKIQARAINDAIEQVSKDLLYRERLQNLQSQKIPSVKLEKMIPQVTVQPVVLQEISSKNSEQLPVKEDEDAASHQSGADEKGAQSESEQQKEDSQNISIDSVSFAQIPLNSDVNDKQTPLGPINEPVTVEPKLEQELPMLAKPPLNGRVFLGKMLFGGLLLAGYLAHRINFLQKPIGDIPLSSRNVTNLSFSNPTSSLCYDPTLLRFENFLCIPEQSLESGISCNASALVPYQEHLICIPEQLFNSKILSNSSVSFSNPRSEYFSTKEVSYLLINPIQTDSPVNDHQDNTFANHNESSLQKSLQKTNGSFQDTDTSSALVASKSNGNAKKMDANLNKGNKNHSENFLNKSVSLGDGSFFPDRGIDKRNFNISINNRRKNDGSGTSSNSLITFDNPSSTVQPEFNSWEPKKLDNGENSKTTYLDTVFKLLGFFAAYLLSNFPETIFSRQNSVTEIQNANNPPAPRTVTDDKVQKTSNEVEFNGTSSIKKKRRRRKTKKVENPEKKAVKPLPIPESPPKMSSTDEQKVSFLDDPDSDDELNAKPPVVPITPARGKSTLNKNVSNRTPAKERGSPLKISTIKYSLATPQEKRSQPLGADFVFNPDELKDKLPRDRHKFPRPTPTQRKKSPPIMPSSENNPSLDSFTSSSLGAATLSTSQASSTSSIEVSSHVPATSSYSEPTPVVFLDSSSTSTVASTVAQIVTSTFSNSPSSSTSSLSSTSIPTRPPSPLFIAKAPPLPPPPLSLPKSTTISSGSGSGSGHNRKPSFWQTMFNTFGFAPEKIDMSSM